MPVDTPDNECCGSDEIFCARTGQCEITAEFANVCGEKSFDLDCKIIVQNSLKFALLALSCAM